jgi:acyl-lipid omega-6 desaturase (Delta-12 desaturase)
MTATAPPAATPRVPDTWKQVVSPYQKSDVRKSIFQIITSVGAYILCFYLMFRSLEVSYWLTLALAFPTAGFAMRMFIIFHDAGHGSFFKSKKANDWIGRITGVLLFTPYYYWRHSHAIHHATSGDLDRRGTGDVWTLTLEEYNKLSRGQQIGYRIYRNPFIIFVIGPFIDFVVLQRFHVKTADERDRASVRNTNIAIAVLVVVLCLLMGWREYLAVQIPIIALASSFGVWLFYVQHQYENVYWERHEQWDFASAALHGSSFYKLPKVLQWFTGNIGFHHIHHLSPRIPNYELEKCHNENELFQQVETMTFWSSLKSLNVRLYDEDHHKMISYHSHGHEDEGTEDGITLATGAQPQAE